MQKVKQESLRALIQTGQLQQHFQPIYNLTSGKLFTYESLVRCQNHNPETLIKLANQENMLYQLDTSGIARSVFTYFTHAAARENKTLFINVFPSTLIHPDFIPFLDNLMLYSQIKASQLVFELNESYEQIQLWEHNTLKEILLALRTMGYRVALDDVGEGATGFKRVIEIEPDFIKLSRYFSDNLSVHKTKQRFVELFTRYCDGQSQIILEGIESAEDLACAKAIGVHFGQGYYLGRPQELANACSS